MRANTIAPRAGFTLIELLAALSLTGLLLLGGAQLLAVTADAGERIRDEVREREAAGVNELLLRGLLSRFDRVPGERIAFDGTATEFTFPSWCERPGGWVSRCRVHVALRALAGSRDDLVVAWEGQSPHSLGSLQRGSRFLFRARGPNGVTWLTNWDAGITAPDVVGIVVEGDTILLPAGPDR